MHRLEGWGTGCIGLIALTTVPDLTDLGSAWSGGFDMCTALAVRRSVWKYTLPLVGDDFWLGIFLERDKGSWVDSILRMSYVHLSKFFFQYGSNFRRF
jgi:hypothetical protein